MAYTTNTKVKSMFRDFPELADVSGQAVTDAEIDEMIDEVDASINATTFSYYDITNLGADSLLVLQRISNHLVAAQVDQILNSYGENDERPKWLQIGTQLLKDIVPQQNAKKQWCVAMKPLYDTPSKGVAGDITNSSIKVSSTTGRTFQKGVDAW